MIDYKDKIRKLLALAQSPNENEAKAALLKARELMAEHKLSEAELKKVEKQAVKDIRTGISCSKQRNPWVILLSSVIGENYCCKQYTIREKGKQTYNIGFIGLEDDAEICTAIFKYAVDSVLSQHKRIKAENREYCSGYTKRLCDSYGYGFAVGVKEAFKKQQDEHAEQGWGLVLVMPQEVEAASQHLKPMQFRSKATDDIEPDLYRKGFDNGKKFDPTKRLAAGA